MPRPRYPLEATDDDIRRSESRRSLRDLTVFVLLIGVLIVASSVWL